MTANGNAKLLYIAGTGRSGSTLLDLLLGNHPDVSGVGEVHRLSLDPDSEPCTCGMTVEKCEYWRAVQEELGNRLGRTIGSWNEFPTTLVTNASPFGRRPGLLELALLVGSRRALRGAAVVNGNVKSHLDIARNSWDLFESVSRVDESQWVVDSTKNAVRMKLLYLTSNSQCQIIQLVRDGRAVAASDMRRDGIDIEQASRLWQRRLRNVLWMGRTIPNRSKQLVRYEDLCDQPEKTLRAICNFMDIRFTEDLLSLGSRDAHNIGGNPMRFSPNQHVKKDERWRDELSRADLMIFDRIAGSMNKRFGYE